MKWYFATNDSSEEFFPLVKAAVLSARKNTTLEPYFIYDGEEDSLTSWLREQGVNIIFHRCSFYDELKAHYGDNIKIPSGAFLRCDIPIIESDDEIVLYTDCDVLFLKDVKVEDIPEFEYFSCSSQFSQKDFVDFNTGVMFIKPQKMAESHALFVDFIKRNLALLSVFDQSAYQIFYRGKNTPLSVKYNHKPYWGIDEQAVILHFHGPKPTSFAGEKPQNTFWSTFYKLYKKAPSAYEYYLKLFLSHYPEFTYNEKFLNELKSGKKIFVKSNACFKLRIFNFFRKKYDKLIIFLQQILKFFHIN